MWCHGFGGFGFGGFGVPGMMGGIFQLVFYVLIAVAAVCAIRWFVKKTDNKEGR